MSLHVVDIPMLSSLVPLQVLPKEIVPSTVCIHEYSETCGTIFSCLVVLSLWMVLPKKIVPPRRTHDYSACMWCCLVVLSLWMVLPKKIVPPRRTHDYSAYMWYDILACLAVPSGGTNCLSWVFSSHWMVLPKIIVPPRRTHDYSAYMWYDILVLSSLVPLNGIT